MIVDVSHHTSKSISHGKIMTPTRFILTLDEEPDRSTNSLANRESVRIGNKFRGTPMTDRSITSTTQRKMRALGKYNGDYPMQPRRRVINHEATSSGENSPEWT